MDPEEPDDELLPMILGVCEDFFAMPAQPSTTSSARSSAPETSAAVPGWLIDMLALTRLRLQTANDPDQPTATDQSAVKTNGD
ncbi:hypothetical protein ACQP2F_33270 [Actinoplanes sp. CA-030573]|uniref:hypothetical protein n=1 Tax=Actinoplanes sp. CA-030573 TaxID=3239898 RepID=UPI003D8B8D20